MITNSEQIEVFDKIFLVNDVMVQLNTDGFKDIEVKGNKIIIPGGHVILGKDKN